MEELLQLGPVGIARLAAARQAIPALLAASGLGSGHSWLFPHPQGGSGVGGDCHGMGLAGGFWGVTVLEVRTGLAPSQHY